MNYDISTLFNFVKMCRSYFIFCEFFILYLFGWICNSLLRGFWVGVAFIYNLSKEHEIYHYLIKVSLTAGPAFGYGRPPSLDIVTSAWIDMGVSYGSKVWKRTKNNS